MFYTSYKVLRGSITNKLSIKNKSVRDRKPVEVRLTAKMSKIIISV